MLILSLGSPLEKVAQLSWDEAPSAELEAAIRRLQADYWARVDYLDPAPPEDLFTDDCVFELGTLTLTGRAELAAFFGRRKETTAASGRVTRHLSANVRLRLLSEGRVAVSTTVMVMTGYGPLPISASVPSVGDFDDICVRGDDGVWRFERRAATSVFAGADAPAFAKATPGSGKGN